MTTDSPNSKRERRLTTCSFCGRTNKVAGAMVEGPMDVYICGDCVEIAYGILLQERARGRVWPDRKEPAMSDPARPDPAAPPPPPAEP